MKRSLGANLFAIAAISAIFIGLPAIWLFSSNFVWVVDPDGQIEKARLVNSAASQDLVRLPWGTHVVYIQLEGSVEAVCRDGTVANGGYVTGFLGGTFDVGDDCTLTLA